MTTRMPPRGEPGELAEIINGTGPDALRSRLMTVLTEPPDATAGAPEARSARIHRLLRRLAETLPPTSELFHDPQKLALLSECVAIADPPLYMAVLSHYTLCLGSIVALTDDPTHLGRRWEALASARSKGVFMVTEIGDASSHLGIRTTAEFDPQAREFVLSTPDAGAAKFSSVGSPGAPQTAVVCARLLVGGTDRGVFSFVVDVSDEQGHPAPGVELSSAIELPALPLDYALVRFKGVRLGYRQWLRDRAHIDERGAFHDPLRTPDARLRRTLCVGQGLWATLPSAMAAMARECSVQALRFSTHRRAHGRLAPGANVLAYRNQQHALLGCLAESFALTCAGRTAREIWTRSLAARGHTPSADRADGMTFAPWTGVDRPLAVLKACAVRGTARIAAECQHRCGVAGCLGLNRLDAYHGFAHAFDSAGGDSHLILLDAGRALAEEARDFRGGIVLPPEVPVDHPAWWLATARTQETWLARELQRTLEERGRARLTGLELWNPLLAAAGELGEAYASRLIAEALAGALAAIRDPELLAVLRPLAALYGAVEARRLSGRLQTTGVLSPFTARELPSVMDGLCDRLMPHLPLLDEAMRAPGGAAPVPLGASDYAAALTSSLDWLPSSQG